MHEMENAKQRQKKKAYYRSMLLKERDLGRTENTLLPF